jgi:hypothetical protein
MTAQKQHPIRNNVIGSLATAAIVAFVVYLIPGGWAWVIEKGGKAIRVIATWLGSSVSVPAWMVLIMSLLALAAIIAVAIVAYAVVRKSDDQIEPFTEAEFFNVKWRWQYGQSGIYNIAAFCPHCDLQVYPTSSSMYRAVDGVFYHCDDCHWKSQEFDFSHAELEDRVRRRIQQQLRRERDQEKRKTA